MQMKEKAFRLINPVDLTSLSLDGERVRLRSINESCALSIFEEFTSKITRFMVPKPAEKIEETLAFISSSKDGMTRECEVVFTIMKKDTEEFLGCCGLHSRGKPATPELGIWLKKEAHGKKYGREAIYVVSRWAVENIDFDFLIYPVDRMNIPSRKIPESMGGIVFKEEKVKTMTGDILDEIVFKLTKNQLLHNQGMDITR